MAEAAEPIDRKLSDIFDEGYNLYHELETTSLPFNSLEFQNKVKKCIELFEDSTRLVSLSGVFSSNEIVEEIASENLRYLLLPFYLGQLCAKNSSHDREEVLKIADIYYKDFIKRCQQYEICPSSSGKTTTNDDQKQLTARDDDDSIRGLIKQATDRNSKIQQYRQRKELEEQINEMKSIVEQRDNVDDDVRRDFYMKLIKLAIIDAETEMKSIEQELQILEFRNARLNNEDNNDGDNSKSDPKSFTDKTSSSHQQHKHVHHHHNAQRRKVEPLKPVIITRDSTQKTVFGLGYPSIPVMTVNEFFEERVREGVFPNAEQVLEMNKKMLKRGDEDAEKEKEDQEKAQNEVLIENDDEQYLERQRAMDEYKDNVRRGDGNRYNRS